MISFLRKEHMYICVTCVYTLLQVIDFFNSRIDSQDREEEWSVEKVLQVIIDNTRSWRGDGMKVNAFELKAILMI